MVAGIMKRTETCAPRAHWLQTRWLFNVALCGKFPHQASACRRPGRPERNGFDFGIEDFHVQTKSRNIAAVFLGAGVLGVDPSLCPGGRRRYQVMPAGPEPPELVAQHLK